MTNGHAVIIGFVSGVIQRLRKDQPIIRGSIMDPNEPSIAVCINESGGIHPNERWYKLSISEIDDPQALAMLRAVIDTRRED